MDPPKLKTMSSFLRKTFYKNYFFVYFFLMFGMAQNFNQAEHIFNFSLKKKKKEVFATSGMLYIFHFHLT